MKKYIIVALVSIIATAAFAGPLLAEEKIEVFVNIQAAATLTLNGNPRLELLPIPGSATDYEGYLDPATAPILVSNVPVTVSALLEIADPFGPLLGTVEGDWAIRVLGASVWTTGYGPSTADYDTVVTDGGYPISVGVRVNDPDLMAVGVEGETPIATVILTVAPR